MLLVPIAFFQPGLPIYSARAVRFRMGHPKSPNFEGDPSDESCHDDKFVWTYTSQEFPMAQVNSSTLAIYLSCLYVFVFGGIVAINDQNWKYGTWQFDFISQILSFSSDSHSVFTCWLKLPFKMPLEILNFTSPFPSDTYIIIMDFLCKHVWKLSLHSWSYTRLCVVPTLLKWLVQVSRLQKFKLPEPVLCIGGYLQIELLGRVQRQEMDGLYYIWSVRYSFTIYFFVYAGCSHI